MIKDNDRSYKVLVKEIKDEQKVEENDKSFTFFAPEEETPIDPSNIVHDIVDAGNNPIVPDPQEVETTQKKEMNPGFKLTKKMKGHFCLNKELKKRSMVQAQMIAN